MNKLERTLLGGLTALTLASGLSNKVLANDEWELHWKRIGNAQVVYEKVNKATGQVVPVDTSVYQDEARNVAASRAVESYMQDQRRDNMESRLKHHYQRAESHLKDKRFFPAVQEMQMELAQYKGKKVPDDISKIALKVFKAYSFDYTNGSSDNVPLLEELTSYGIGNNDWQILAFLGVRSNNEDYIRRSVSLNKKPATTYLNKEMTDWQKNRFKKYLK